MVRSNQVDFSTLQEGVKNEYHRKIIENTERKLLKFRQEESGLEFLVRVQQPSGNRIKTGERGKKRVLN